MKELFYKLRIIFTALLGGQFLFWIIVFFLYPENTSEEQSLSGDDLYDTILPIFMLSMIFATYLIDKQRQQRGALLKSLDQKIAYFRSSVLLRLALMELTNIFILIIILLEVKLNYSIYFFIGVMAFFYFKPDLGKFRQEYGLTGEQKAILDKVLEE